MGPWGPVEEHPARKNPKNGKKKLLTLKPSCQVLTEHYNCAAGRICHAKAFSAALSPIQKN